MKNATIFFLAVFFVTGAGWVVWSSEVRDTKLMELCADHTTRTLHECK